MGEPGRKALFFVLIVFLYRVRASRYLGCYKDSSSVRILPDVKKDYKGYLTIQMCFDLCREKGFRYSGVQWRFECFCSNDRPSFKFMADDGDCNLYCDGDNTQICGGNLRINIYDMEDDAENAVANNHIGCFVNFNEVMFKAPSWSSDFQTPESCVGFCYRRGYRFGGIQNGRECICGDVLKKIQKVGIAECSFDCEGDERLKCGGNQKLSVYHTGIPDLPSDGNEIGCFKDDAPNLRLLSALKLDLKQTNTPRRCMNICLASGFKYSGTEYGSECFCGNRKPPAEKEAEEKHCLMKCPANKEEYCGGTWKILIYSTGSGKVKPVIPEMSLAVATQKPSTANRNPSSSLPLVDPHKPVPTRKPSTAPNRTSPRPNHTSPMKPQSASSTKPHSTSSTKPHSTSSTRPHSTSSTKPQTTPVRKCEPSKTVVNGRPACKGQLIFREDFLGPEIDSKKWAHEVFMPMYPDYEFVMFGDKSHNSFIKDRKLFIKPSMLDDDFVRTGNIELQNCTGQQHSEECTRHAATYSIIPPIESARINTKQFFSFQYGTIHIRAKLPLGDWIIPEIWLEPRRKSYGVGYTSGRVRIAMARGNRNLSYGQYDEGNERLESGILMGIGENVRARIIDAYDSAGWHSNFHNFTLVWEPGSMAFLVDGANEVDLVPSPNDNLCHLVGFNEKECATWQSGTNIAPFDKEFYISLGLSVGGMRDFKDGIYRKPWKNKSVKALANFWQDRDSWKGTWNGDSSALQIDSVKVFAI